MAIGSGLGGSLGLAPETTYGTYATIGKWLEANKIDIEKAKTIVQGGGLAAGRTAQLGARRLQVAEMGTGSIDLEVTMSAFGLILLHTFGAGTITQIGGTAAWRQAFTVADNIGKSLSVQSAVPDTGGVIRPYTGLGGKITKLSLSCTTTGLLMATIELDFQKVGEAQTLVAPSFTVVTQAFSGRDMRVRLGAFGSEAAVQGVKGFTMDFERAQKTDRIYAAVNTGPAVKSEPIMNDYFKVSGTLDIDLVNKADFVDRFAADTSTSMVVEFISTLLASAGNPFSLGLNTPATFFENGTPTVQGADVVGLSVPFTGQLDLTNGQATATYVSTDTTLAA